MPQASGWVCVCVTACWRLCRQLVVPSKATAAETSDALRRCVSDRSTTDGRLLRTDAGSFPPPLKEPNQTS